MATVTTPHSPSYFLLKLPSRRTLQCFWKAPAGGRFPFSGINFPPFIPPQIADIEMIMFDANSRCQWRCTQQHMYESSPAEGLLVCLIALVSQPKQSVCKDSDA